jgi:hypothetical protein
MGKSYEKIKQISLTSSSCDVGGDTSLPRRVKSNTQPFHFHVFHFQLISLSVFEFVFGDESNSNIWGVVMSVSLALLLPMVMWM